MPSIQFAAFVFCGTLLAQIQVHRFLDLPGEASDPGISPDGKTLAFRWWPPDEKKWGLYTRAMSGGAPKLFATDDASIAVSPRWSPDGQWIAFLRWDTPRTASVFVQPARGGEERRIGPACNDEVAWTADSRSLIMPDNGNSDSIEECRIVDVPIGQNAGNWRIEAFLQ